MEKIEEWFKDWIDFKGSLFEEEDDFILVLDKLVLRKKELKVSEDEWFSIWMLEELKKRKGMDTFQYQSLRNVIKKGGDDLTMRFGDRFRELKVEGIREKAVET